MVVPKGYKETDIGLLPRQWGVVPISETGEVLSGLTYSPENIRPYGLLVLRSSNIKNGKIVFDDTLYVDKKIEPNRYLQDKDIVICVQNGSKELIGKSALYKGTMTATFGAFIAVFRGEHSNFVFHVLQSSIFQKQIDKNSNATINQITGTDFKQIVIPYPSIPEQHAIATALSDVDELIDSLESLIEKKKAIKQGAMQELLTGRKRLPGFKGEWTEKPLGELFNFYGGVSASRDMLSTTGYCYLHYGDIHSAHKPYIDTTKDYSLIPKFEIDLRKVSNNFSS